MVVLAPLLFSESCEQRVCVMLRFAVPSRRRRAMRLRSCHGAGSCKVEVSFMV